MQLFKKKKSYHKIGEKSKKQSKYSQNRVYIIKVAVIIRKIYVYSKPKYQIHRNFTPEKLVQSSRFMQSKMQAEMQKTSLAV